MTFSQTTLDGLKRNMISKPIDASPRAAATEYFRKESSFISLQHKPHGMINSLNFFYTDGRKIIHSRRACRKRISSDIGTIAKSSFKIRKTSYYREKQAQKMFSARLPFWVTYESMTRSLICFFISRFAFFIFT